MVSTVSTVYAYVILESISLNLIQQSTRHHGSDQNNVGAQRSGAGGGWGVR